MHLHFSHFCFIDHRRRKFDPSRHFHRHQRCWKLNNNRKNDVSVHKLPDGMDLKFYIYSFRFVKRGIKMRLDSYLFIWALVMWMANFNCSAGQRRVE